MKLWLTAVLILSSFSGPAFGLQSTADLTVPEFHGTPLSTSFGGFDAPPREAIGKIADLRVADSLGVFVLDQFYHEVKWFDPTGQIIASVGREGQGPGELFHPIALDYSPSDKALYILDRGNIRVSAVDLQAQDVSAQAWFRIPMPAVDFCVVDDMAFLLLETGDAVVHAFDIEQDRISAAWGVPADVSQIDEGSGRNSARETVGATRLECDASKGLMIVASQMRGRVWAYSFSGELVWSVDLPNYYRSNVVPVEVGGRPGYTFEMEGPDDSFHSIHRMLFKERSVLIQASLMNFTINEAGWGEVTTFELDLASGAVLDRSVGLPLIGGWTDEFSAVWTNGPTPAVGITTSGTIDQVIR